MVDTRRPPHSADALLADAARSIPGALALASLVPQAARIERPLLRALRLQLVPQCGAADEAELWSSDLVEVRGLDGLLLRADVLELLRQRARHLLAAGGEAAERLHRARQLLDSHHAHAPPLVRLEEEVAWLAMAEAQLGPAIERRLEVALAALVRDQRVGVARWAARALPRLPEPARQTRTAWLLSLATADRLPASARALGVPPRDQSGLVDLAALAPHLGIAPLGVRRIGNRVELGAVGPGGLALQVPASEPRFISLHDPAARQPQDIAVAAGSLRAFDVSWQTLTLRSADGQTWDLPVHSPDEQRWLAGVTLRLEAGRGKRGQIRWLGTAIGNDRLLTALPAAKLGMPMTAALADGRAMGLHLTPSVGTPGVLAQGRLPSAMGGVALLPAAGRMADGARVVACGLDSRGALQPVVGTWFADSATGAWVLARTLAEPGGCLGAPVVIDGQLAGVVLSAVETNADPADSRAPKARPGPGRTLRLVVASPTTADMAGSDGLAKTPPPATDQLTVALLPAAQGQAVLVSWGPGNGRHHLLVDTGPRSTAKAIATRVMATTGGRLDLLVVSHADADRIEGLGALLAAGVAVDELWFNGPGQLAAPFGVTAAPTVAVERLLEQLSQRSVPLNTAFQAGPVMVSPEGPLPRVERPGGLVITLLAPTPALLQSASANWRRAAERRRDSGSGARSKSEASGMSASQSAAEDDALMEPGEEPASPPREPAASAKATPARRFGGDRSVNNGASIVLHIEYRGQQLLLAGDAHADTLLQAVRRLAAERDRTGLFVDLFVLPRGGSRGNVTPELFDALEAGAFAVSSNGALFRHPDPETIDLIANRSPGAVIAFNYRSQTTERWADPVLAKQLNLTTRYPDGGDEGIALVLEPPHA